MENKDALLEGSVDILDILTEFVQSERAILQEKDNENIVKVNGMQTDRERFLISLQGAITKDNTVIKDSFKKEYFGKNSDSVQIEKVL